MSLQWRSEFPLLLECLQENPNPKICEQHVVPSSISLYKLWGILIGYLLSNPDLHPISTSRKELFGLHDMVIERGPRKATIVLSIEALKMH